MSPPTPPIPVTVPETIAVSTLDVPGSREPGLHLVVFFGDGVKARRVPEGCAVTVGRAPDCDLQIDVPSMSRKHFVIREGPPAFLEDLESRNGVKVNGTAVPAMSSTPIEIGNLIEAGGVFFMLRNQGPGALPKSRVERVSQDDTVLRADPLREVIVADAAMARLHGLVDQVARSDISVLVIGETGVGKEVISAAIHQRSPRAGKPFVKLNCAALPEPLLESELFGHERGAFTGAAQTKPGLIEAAHGGTLFLDEIGEMPPATQSKLLRVFEGGEIQRVGSLRPRTVDVRLIAATNRNLPALLAKGAFRRDLYFRLNGITIPIPPLRERSSEIPALAAFFLERAAKRAGRTPPKLGPDVLTMLASHSWPGNIRELKNAMDRAVTLCQEGTLRPEHVSLESAVSVLEETAVPATSTRNTPLPTEPPALQQTGRLIRTDPATEKTLLMDALERTGGNQSKASTILGISRRTLINRMDEYGLKRPRKSGPP